MNFLQLGDVSSRNVMNDSVSAGTFKRSPLYTKPWHAETLVFTGSSITSEVHKRRCQFISRSAEFIVEMSRCNNMFVVTRCSEGSFSLKNSRFYSRQLHKIFLKCRQLWQSFSCIRKHRLVDYRRTFMFKRQVCNKWF